MWNSGLTGLGHTLCHIFTFDSIRNNHTNSSGDEIQFWNRVVSVMRFAWSSCASMRSWNLQAHVCGNTSKTFFSNENISCLLTGYITPRVYASFFFSFLLLFKIWNKNRDFPLSTCAGSSTRKLQHDVIVSFCRCSGQWRRSRESPEGAYKSVR